MYDEGAELQPEGKKHTSDERAMRQGDAAKVLWPKLCTAFKAGQPLRPGPRLIVPKAKMWAAAPLNAVQRKDKAASAAGPAAGGPARILRPLPRPLPRGNTATAMLLNQAAAAAAAAAAEVAARHAQGTLRGKGKASPRQWYGVAGGRELLPPPPPPPWLCESSEGAANSICRPRWPAGSAT